MEFQDPRRVGQVHGTAHAISCGWQGRCRSAARDLSFGDGGRQAQEEGEVKVKVNVSLKGKVAVVTGAGRGLGRQTALTFGRTWSRGRRGFPQCRTIAPDRANDQASRWRGARDASRYQPARSRGGIEKGSGTTLWGCLHSGKRRGDFRPDPAHQRQRPETLDRYLGRQFIRPLFYLSRFCRRNDSKPVGPDHQLHLGRRAASARPAQQRVRHEQSGSQSVHATPRRRVGRNGRDRQCSSPGRCENRDVGRRFAPKPNGWDLKRKAYRKWVRWVEQTGGDDPQKAADLVLRLLSDEAAAINGKFLWIEGGLQSPIPSWGDAASAQPWRES